MVESKEQEGSGVMRVLAVDDEQPALDELLYLLRAEPAVTELHGAADATGALRILRAHGADAVFLDINMPGLDGMELAGVLAEFVNPPAIVFVTAHEDHAVAAFDLGAVDYLLKPVRRQRLAAAVRRIAERRARTEPEPAPDPGASHEVIPVELGGVTTLVHRSQVNWVEAEGDYARLHTDTGSHLVRIPLSALQERWRDDFLRVHRSYLVALGRVTGLRTAGSGTLVCLRGAQRVELPVSRRQVRELKQRLVHGPHPSPDRR
ncbi:LytR/AlgR family response regulator transcription factor [Nocardia sp. NPDC003963]